MADQFWRYAPDPRHQAAMVPASQASLKRSRPDFPDMQAAPEMLGYYSREDERTAPRIPRDTESINASYERYLRNGLSSYPPADPIRPVAGGLTGRPVEDARLIGMDSRRPVEDARLIGMDSRRPVEDARLIGIDSRNAPYASARPEAPLPPDASNTLFIEGLPANCTRREVSHIFRPFVGFREVRLVNKASRHDGGDPLVLCFVDFATSSQAASALDALQGYKFDEHDRESANLRLQFARFPGPRSAGGPRGRR